MGPGWRVVRRRQVSRSRLSDIRTILVRARPVDLVDDRSGVAVATGVYSGRVG